MNIKEATDQWQDLDDFIRESCEKLRQTVDNIDDELGGEVSIGYPRPQEDLVSFEVGQNALHTHWEYVDGYEEIGDSETTWEIEFKWFDMTYEELKEVFREQAEYRFKKARERELNRLKMEAEHFGFKVVEEETPHEKEVPCNSNNTF